MNRPVGWRNHLCSTMALLLLSGLAFGSINSKSNLDQTVDQVIQHLEVCDINGLKSMSHPDLAAKLSLESVGSHCTLVQRLGAVQTRNMQGLNVQAGAPDVGTYSVVFDQGTATVKVSIKEAQLFSYNLSGPDVVRIIGEMQAEKYKVFAVNQFHWTLPDGTRNPKGNVLPVGKVHFKAVLYGLTVNEGKMRLTSDLLIKDPAGKEVNRYDKYLDQELVLPEGSHPTATVDSWFKIEEPGTWTVDIGFTDVLSGKELITTQSFVAE